MIIKKEVFNNLSNEQIKELCSQYNKTVATKFFIKDNFFCIGTGVKIPLALFTYKTYINREALMTSDEFKAEAAAGNIDSVKYENGQIIF